jgi:hypothetical protein
VQWGDAWQVERDVSLRFTQAADTGPR